MNGPIRRVAFIVAAMFTSLLISCTWIQVVNAGTLEKKPTNVRTLYKEYARQRGPLLLDSGTAVAESTPSKDLYKFLRKYPGGAVYAPVTGYFSTIFGATGLESTEDSLLAGTSGQLFYRRISDLLTGRQPEGAQVTLTIQAKVQEAAYKAMGNQRGAVVALDPKTGDVLAMVSKPSYDPDLLASHNQDDVRKANKKLLDDPNDPQLNRAIRQTYPPGSTFKVIMSAAALSNGYTPDSEVDGPAALKLPQTTTLLHNDDGAACGPGDKTTLIHALEISCNTAYASLGLKLGQQTVRDQAAKFGFGQELSIPLRVSQSTIPGELNQPQLAQSSIGQFEDKVTPLQMAMVAAGVANDGVVMRPNLIKRVTTSEGQVLDEPKPEQLSEAMTPDVAGQLTTMMEAVVNSGTGTRAQIPGVQVAGKTGTAQHGTGAAPHAWFISFAPANDPKVAVAVLIEDGGRLGNEAFGGTVAAPIAKAVMEAVINK
jgi:peptidoglycan glycosyltransferase